MLFWRADEKEQEKKLSDKISSITQEIEEIQQRNSSLHSQMGELNSKLNSQDLQKVYKGLKAERKATSDLHQSLEQQVLHLRSRLSAQIPLEDKCRSTREEMENISKANDRLRQDIQQMSSKVKDCKELKDELKKTKSEKKTLMQENNVLQREVEDLRKRISRQDHCYHHRILRSSSGVLTA